MANQLQFENSPYLKQHAHNPVDWMPWGPEALKKATDENKLIIISIGYSACHWCHVMERESFENSAIAQTMNKFFVSIKIDREERPDIDQVYMLAVQLMTNAGGWPLNCICLPDGRPIYGGTYFKPHDWQNILLQIAQMWEEKPEVALEYADKLNNGIQRAEKLPIHSIPEQYTREDLREIVTPWIETFDKKEGGYQRAPKFPLPNNWLFFLKYGVLADDEEILNHVHFTLKKIGSGGIYDQIGGGFARYSVDPYWHIPHFEKMLYDNGQLLSLYAEAYQQHKDPFYKRIIEETIAWAEREMLAPNHGFYSALDADSEGIEGKFYSFSKTELDEVLGKDAGLFSQYFNITELGNWEEEQTNIPICAINADQLAAKVNMSADEWSEFLKDSKKKLYDFREKRVRPGLDHKQLTSWNALFLKGLVDAYSSLDNRHFLELALNNAQFICNELIQNNGQLLHQPEDKNRAIAGFLDDYAFTVEAFIVLYEATFDFNWLTKARQLADKAIALFYDGSQKTFYYTSSEAEQLIARKSEIMDNVIPSSSSTMTRQLKRLGLLFDNENYIAISDQLLANVFPQIKTYGSAYSNWAILLLEERYGINEIALTGKKAMAFKHELDQYYIPNKIVLGGTEENLPLLKHRVGKETKAYICKNRTCSLPQDSIKALINYI
ncbi:thioredoxin domain-containing protein [uncultured Sphingobacterium sp.]|uniref:thioredoxin domain-containing protein n=1 Tax=uncultured Sphingobacterium sp. TaxID=182688 RepID=UPI0025DD375D|nr:thioredoxin domain-containing protein [uncultured Sphingobacterium sp.]